MEVQRMSGVSPLAIPRRALKSIPFEGYIIPQVSSFINYVNINLFISIYI
jgi:hypothetical protein